VILEALETAGLAGTTRVLFFSDHGTNLGARALWGKSSMYEESAGIPMLMAGPGIACGATVATAVSLVDVYPTILDWTGVATTAEERLLPGRALSQVAFRPDDDERTVLSEYHAAGAISGVFMLRQGRLKYIHYTGYAAELYDLHDDPEEMNDLGVHPAYASTIDRFRAMLLAHCNPQDVDRHAKCDQAALVDRHGGREAVLARGGGSYTPIPGEQPMFIKA